MIKLEFKSAAEQRVIGYDLINDREILSPVDDDKQHDLKFKKKTSSKNLNRRT